VNAVAPSWTAPAADATSGVYRRAIRRHWLVVVLVTIAALGASIAWLAARAPQYQAKSQVLVAPVSADAQIFVGLPLLRDSSNDPTRVLETAATVLRSPQAADRAARLMGRGWDANRVLDSVAVIPQSRSNIVEVAGTADRAKEAALLSNNFARAALAVRAEALQRQLQAIIGRLRARQAGLQQQDPRASDDLAARIGELEAVQEGGDPTLSLTRAATVPTSRAGAAAPIVLILSLIAGVTLGIAAAILLEMLNRRVRDENEAIELYDLPVLARIPVFPMRTRRGAQIQNGNVSLPPAILEASRTVLAQLTAQDHKGSRSIMVTSASTGDGKTTSAVSLAIAFATARYQVLLLDMDVRKPGVGRMLGVKAEPLASLLSAYSGNSFARLFREVPGIENLSVLATAGVGEVREDTGPQQPQQQQQQQRGRLDVGSAGDIPIVELMLERFPLLLAEARAAADYVVIDTPPLGEFSDALRIAHDVDDVIVVARPRHTNRTSFEVMRDLLDRTGHVPAGMLVIGGSHTVQPHYYDRDERAAGSGRLLTRLRP
jgi:Mrp family chromosome partitioning ATPase/capsular polysaccharide biosynthesis protein